MTSDEVAQIRGDLENFRQEVIEAFNGLNQRMNSLETRMTGLEGRIAGLEGRFAGLEGRLGTVEQAVFATQRDVRQQAAVGFNPDGSRASAEPETG